jgi:N-acetylglucosamine kinase-like BadF-type ATPase
MKTPRYILGVDGGGTKTAALVATAAGDVLGAGYGASSNHQKVGFAAAAQALVEAEAAAWQAAGLPPQAPAAICLGLSGVDRDEDQQMWLRWLAETHPQSSHTVINDAELALAAGTDEGWGVGVVCGTGSICVGRNRAGRTARADGWGFILGDEGSGYALGRAAMRAVMRAYDGRGPATLLTEGVLAHWSLPNPEALITVVYIEDASPARIASLASVVNQAADAGDGVALEILRVGGNGLACTIGAVVRNLEMEGPVPCALAGGVITGSRMMAAFLRESAQRAGLLLAPVTLVHRPAEGAVRLAQRLLAT